MIWRRLKRSTPEEDQKFAEMMKEEKVSYKERLVMMITAYAVIFIPCVIVLLLFGLLALWIFGAI